MSNRPETTKIAYRLPRWSLATMLWATACVGGVIATVQTMGSGALLTLPLWTAALGAIVARGRTSGVVRGYVYGVLLFLLIIIVTGALGGMLGYMGVIE